MLACGKQELATSVLLAQRCKAAQNLAMSNCPPRPAAPPFPAAAFEGLKRTQSTQSGERGGWRGHGGERGVHSGGPGGGAHAEPVGSPLARSLSRGRSGDIVRSDYEERQAVAMLQAIELVKHATDVSGRPCWLAAAPCAAPLCSLWTDGSRLPLGMLCRTLNMRTKHNMRCGMRLTPLPRPAPLLPTAAARPGGHLWPRAALGRPAGCQPPRHRPGEPRLALLGAVGLLSCPLQIWSNSLQSGQSCSRAGRDRR